MLTFKSISFIVLIACFTMCGPSTDSQLESNKQIVGRLLESINTRDFDILNEIVASDFVRHCQATPDVQVKSLDDLKQFLQGDLEVFPDGQIRQEILIAEGNMLAGYFMYIGTQEGKMGPFPATGKKVELGYLAIIRLEEGKIAEMWVEWDNLAILRQLGHFPPQSQ